MKIKTQYATETYFSEGGYFCIRQDTDDNESIVMLSPYQCAILAKELSKVAKQKGWWVDVVEGKDER